jgi:hypothetical protein
MRAFLRRKKIAFELERPSTAFNLKKAPQLLRIEAFFVGGSEVTQTVLP